MKDKYIVHTNNRHTIAKAGVSSTILIPNFRFNNYYYGEFDNTDRLTIVGIPNIEDKTISIGISFCTGNDNFSRVRGTKTATMRAKAFRYSDTLAYKPYAVIEITEVEFTQEACLNVLYAIHDGLIKLSVKEVKKLVNKQIVK